MDYVYSPNYGDKANMGIKHKKDRHGEDIPWQYDHDKAVDKGLMQIYKEDKLPYAKLLAVLRKETYQAMHSQDRWRVEAYKQLDKYTGNAKLLGKVSYGDMSQYWVVMLQGEV